MANPNETCYGAFLLAIRTIDENRFLRVNGKQLLLLLSFDTVALSHLFPSEVRVIPCIVSKHFDGLISFHSSIVQPRVYNQPHCSPNLEGEKVKYSPF